MRRSNVPRQRFIDKLYRARAKPWGVIDQMRSKLKPHCAAVPFPIGLEEDNHEGVVDAIRHRVFYFDGVKGQPLHNVLSQMGDGCWNRVCCPRG